MTELENMKAALENFIESSKKMTERIEEIYAEQLDKAEKVKFGVWSPKIGEKYFYQSPFGGVDDVTCEDDNSDIEAISLQRVYPTKELAEAKDHRKEKIAVWNKLREMETEAVDWEYGKQVKYFICLNHNVKVFSIGSCTSSHYIPETEWYTTSLAASEWVIANMQTELKKIWRV